MLRSSRIITHFALDESLKESDKVPCMVGSDVEPSGRVTGGHIDFCRSVKHCTTL